MEPKTIIYALIGVALAYALVASSTQQELPCWSSSELTCTCHYDEMGEMQLECLPTTPPSTEPATSIREMRYVPTQEIIDECNCSRYKNGN